MWSHLAYKLTSEPEIESESQKIKRVPDADGPRSRVGLGDSCKVASKAKNNPVYRKYAQANRLSPRKPLGQVGLGIE